MNRLTLLALAVVAPCAVVGRAQAQSKEDLANAEALFNAAKALLESGQVADACSKFAESKHLAPGLGVTLYLADCYERIGRTASAWTEFRAAEGLARSRNDQRAEVAQSRAQALEAKLERLTIVVAPTVPRVGLRILLDGAPVPAEEWGLPVAVDPGDHVVIASDSEHPKRTFAIRIGPDTASSTVRIDSLEETPAPSQPSPSQPSQPPATAPASSGEVAQSNEGRAGPVQPSSPSYSGAINRWVGIGAGALGLVGIGIGSVFGLSAKSNLDQSNQSSGSQPAPCNQNNYCTANGLNLRKEAGNAADVSTALFVVGGVALAAGVVLYFTAPHAPSGVALTLVPAPLTGGAGALVHGTF